MARNVVRWGSQGRRSLGGGPGGGRVRRHRDTTAIHDLDQQVDVLLGRVRELDPEVGQALADTGHSGVLMSRMLASSRPSRSTSSASFQACSRWWPG